MIKTFAATAIMLLTFSAVGAELPGPAEVQLVLKKYDSVRPRQRDLRIFQLDWTESLAEAKRQAAGDGRPVLLIVVRNSYGDIFAGHC